MAGKSFELNETTLPVIEELGRHMPGGFFIYQKRAPENLLYANKACFAIFGCNGPEDFKALTGYTFKGLVYPEDYEATSSSISEQIDKNEDNMDYVEYRIRRKDGQLRWVDDYGHYTVTEQYGGVYYEKMKRYEEQLQSIYTSLGKNFYLADDLRGLHP